MKVHWGTCPPFMEYFNDKQLIDVAIQIEFIYKTTIDNFVFKYLYHTKELAVSCVQVGGLIQLLIEDLQIPISLLEQFKKGEAIYYINSIINNILPLVSNKLKEQKYRKGNILIDRICFLDIQKITLIYLEEQGGWQTVIIPWTLFPKELPLLKDFFIGKTPPLYIRDYIDAMEMYIKYDFDGCIRKIITSLENCFSYYKLKVSKISFLQILPYKLDKLIYPRGRIPRLIKRYIVQSIVQKNILFIYKLRNKIIHEGFSLKYDQGWICKKAISTMSYIFQHPFMKVNEKEYIYLLVMHFLLITQEIQGVDLEENRLWWRKFEILSEKEKEKLVIKTPKDMDDFVFSGLEIRKKEIKEKLGY